MAATLADAAFVLMLGWICGTDLNRRVIEDRALTAFLVVSLPLLAAAGQLDPGTRLAWSAGAGGFLLLTHLASPSGMGLGDVKLAAVMGFHLGPGVVPALMLALLGGVAAGVVIACRLGLRGARGATIPFGPFLTAGAVAALLGAQ